MRTSLSIHPAVKFFDMIWNLWSSSKVQYQVPTWEKEEEGRAGNEREEERMKGDEGFDV